MSTWKQLKYLSVWNPSQTQLDQYLKCAPILQELRIHGRRKRKIEATLPDSIQIVDLMNLQSLEPVVLKHFKEQDFIILGQTSVIKEFSSD